MFSLNPRRCGNVMAIDGRETWLVHNYLLDSEEDFDSVDRDWAIRAILGVDDDFEYELLGKEDWIGRRLVANKFREDRVFICGDAAHLWVPYAGYGMNAGIADAANLAWLIAARLKGWGGQAAARCLRGGAPAHHGAGLALCDEPLASHGKAAGSRAGRDRAPGARRRRRARGTRQGGLRAQRAAILLRRLELRLLLQRVADHLPTTESRRRPTRCTTSARLPCLAAERRMCGSATDDRCTTRWDPITRCCASTLRPT